MEKTLSYIPLGGVGEVTKNLHIYQFGNEILLVDCGLGFSNETMIGVDLLLPDITYLLKLVQQGKQIVGMVITHGHEDHMGALPFILPQLPQFPIYATAFTSALANEKLKQFELKMVVKEIPFKQEVRIGSFTCEFIQVTHSVPDTSHIFIKTPVGNFYHGSDFKFDLTPFDEQKTDFQEIGRVGNMGVRCLLSECLGAEREGYTPTDKILTEHFEHEMRNCKGKFIVTTYSSNIARLNQIISVAEKLNKYVCFVGRSLIKTKDLARQRGLLKLRKEREVTIDQVKRINPKDLVLFVAGSQGQENSALTRVIAGAHKDIQLQKQDTIVFSADPIPGNEISVYSLIDEISRLGIRVVYSSLSEKFHVSGHGSSEELLLLMSFLKPRQVLPISGGYRQMMAYKHLAKQFGFVEQDVIIPQNGQEVIFSKERTTFGQKIPLRNIYVDEISGEEVDQYILRDRQKISQEGIVVIIAEMDSTTGALAGKPQIVVRGINQSDVEDVDKALFAAFQKAFLGQKTINDWNYVRKQMREVAEKAIFHKTKRQPLVMPVIIEV